MSIVSDWVEREGHFAPGLSRPKLDEPKNNIDYGRAKDCQDDKLIHKIAFISGVSESRH